METRIRFPREADIRILPVERREEHTLPDTILLETETTLEYGETFENDTTLFQRFSELGYHADTIDKLNLLLEDVEITIHPFEDPYSSDDSKRRKCA